jgi:hypothetical protein
MPLAVEGQSMRCLELAWLGPFATQAADIAALGPKPRPAAKFSAPLPVFTPLRSVTINNS